MKKKVIALMMMACLVFSYACDDSYPEIEEQEIFEVESTDDEEGEEGDPTAPGSGGVPAKNS